MYYRTQEPASTTIEANESYEGESIEQKVRRILTNGEAIKDGAPLIYTERKDGVRPEYDIRTDRFEVATEAMDAVTRAKIAKREGGGKVVDLKTDKDGKDNKNAGGKEGGSGETSGAAGGEGGKA